MTSTPTPDALGALYYDALYEIAHLPEQGGCDDGIDAVDLWRLMQRKAQEALASTGAGKEEADVLALACKPWENGRRQPPDYDSPLMDVFDAGVTYTMNILATLVGAKDYVGADGSDSHEGDVCGTLRNLLIAAGYCNADGDDLLTGPELRTIARAIEWNA